MSALADHRSQKLTTWSPLAQGPEHYFRPMSLQGSIFIDFLTPQTDTEKSTIFRIIKNQPHEPQISILGRPRVDFSWILMTFGVSFCIDFATFFETSKFWKTNVFPKEKQRFSMSKGSQKPSIFHWFLDDFSSFCENVPGNHFFTFFSGFFAKSDDFGTRLDFVDSQNGALEAPFSRQKS